MARTGLTTALAAEFDKQNLGAVLFIEGETASGWLRLWSGIGKLNWRGNDWYGIQTPTGEVLAAISEIVETSDVQAQGVTVTINTVPRDSVLRAINDCRQTYDVRIYFGAMDKTTLAVVPDPYLAFAGKMDVPTAVHESKGCTLSLTVESRLLDLQRPRKWRYTNEDQQLLHPGDTAGRFIPALQDFTVTWGQGGGYAPHAPIYIQK